MIDDEEIVFTDNGSTHNNNDKYRTSPTIRRNSVLGFDDCVKLNVFKKNETGNNKDVINFSSIPDSSLLFLTKNNELLNSFDLKLKFDDLIAEKKLKESNDYKKKKYENVSAKLNENRNPNIKNLLKDLTKKPVELTIKKLQKGYNMELDEVFNNHDESLKDSKIASSTSKKSILLEDSSTFENKIQENNENNIETEDGIFLTDAKVIEEENEEENDDDDDKEEVDSDGYSGNYSNSDDDKDAKNNLKNFEEKYAHLLTEDSDLTTHSSSTAELVQDETVKLSSDKESRKTKRSKKTDEMPVLPLIDHDKVARDMRLTLFNSIQPSESSMNHLNSKLNDLKQIHLPSFQAQFHQVCQYGDDSRIVKLITQDIDYDVNRKSNGLGRFCIHECCLNGNVSMLKGLLSYVDDLNKQDKNGQTAAHICAKHGELECLKILAANSANLTLSDKNGMQLSHLAAKNNHTNIIEFLFNMGLSLKVASEEGKLPLHYAAQYGSFECLKILTEYYVDISQVDNDGNCAAHLASMYDHIKCLKYLKKIGTPINASLNRKGRAIAHVAALHNSIKSLHWLLENGADRELRDYDGNSLIHLACLGGNADAMNCCIQHDISLSVVNDKGETPMDIARLIGKSLHMKKAISNDIRCPNCVKIAVKLKWEEEHQKTIAEKTIEKNKDKYYNLKKRIESVRNMTAVSTRSKATGRDLIAQYFGPTLKN